MATRFNVRIERTEVHSAFVEVSADNEDEASDKATKMAEKYPSRFEWELESEDFEATGVDEGEADEEDDFVEDDDEETEDE